MCSTDWLDIPSIFREAVITARKTHKCSECCRDISAKEQYHYAFGVWDGKADVFKTCKGCMAPREWVMQECGGYALGNLFEEIYEHASEYKSMKLYRWAVNIRRGWKYTI